MKIAHSTDTAGITCPRCRKPMEHILRTMRGVNHVLRRRECSCGHRETTVERVIGGHSPDEPLRVATTIGDLALSLGITSQLSAVLGTLQTDKGETDNA